MGRNAQRRREAKRPAGPSGHANLAGNRRSRRHPRSQASLVREYLHIQETVGPIAADEFAQANMEDEDGD